MPAATASWSPKSAAPPPPPTLPSCKYASSGSLDTGPDGPGALLPERGAASVPAVAPGLVSPNLRPESRISRPRRSHCSDASSTAASVSGSSAWVRSMSTSISRLAFVVASDASSIAFIAASVANDARSVAWMQGVQRVSAQMRWRRTWLGVPRTLSVGHMASMNTVMVLHTAAVAAHSMATARPQDGSAVWPAAVVAAAPVYGATAATPTLATWLGVESPLGSVLRGDRQREGVLRVR